MGEAKRRSEEKQEAFNQDPERFVDKKDIIMAAVLRDDPEGKVGIGYFGNGGIPDHTLKVAIYDLKEMVDMLLMKRKAVKEANRIKDNRIITE